MSNVLNPLSNGKSDEQLRDEQAKRNIHQSNLNGQQRPSEAVPNKEYLQEITDNQLDGATYELLQNLFSHDFVLSNLEGAEVTEQKWLARVVARKAKRMHPGSESFATGESRAVIFEDGGSALEPLNPQQESLIDQAVLQFLTRPPRSRGGWQQDEVSKQLKVSRVEDNNDEEKRGLFGL